MGITWLIGFESKFRDSPQDLKCYQDDEVTEMLGSYQT